MHEIHRGPRRRASRRHHLRRATAAAIASTHEAYGLCANGEDCFLALRGFERLRCAWSGIGDRGSKSRLAPRPAGGRGSPASCFARRSRPRALETRLQGRGRPVLDHFEAVLEAGRPAHAERAGNLRHGLFLGRVREPIVPFDCTAARTATAWKAEGPALRLHIGLEDVGDLKRDLERGFAALAEAGAIAL